MGKKKQVKNSAQSDQLDQIKRLAVIAMFSDDELMDRLVLKGGNAMDLTYRISTRASVDIDFSMQEDFPPGKFGEYVERVERVLRQTFRAAGYEAFDIKMQERPEGLTADLADFWGGYGVEFKLVDHARFLEFSNDPAALRRNALMLGQGSKFLIDISRFEYTKGKEARDFDGYRIYVYTADMIVCEKLRAICQQMPEYGPIVKRKRAGSPRARDFLDIHTLVTRRDVDLTATTVQASRRCSLPFFARSVCR